MVLTPARDGRIVLDLFAGSGSSTEPFRAAGWTVLEIDLAPRPAAGRIVADVRRLPLAVGQLRGRVALLWASPPCTEFSDANARVNHATKRPSLDLVHATLEAVAEFRPTFWVLENVRGAIPFLGIPVQKIGPFCLWGYFPTIDVTLAAHDYRKGEAGRTPAERARIPGELSAGLFRSVTRALEHPGVSLLDLRPFRRHRHVAVRRPRAAGPDIFGGGGEVG